MTDNKWSVWRIVKKTASWYDDTRAEKFYFGILCGESLLRLFMIRGIVAGNKQHRKLLYEAIAP